MTKQEKIQEAYGIHFGKVKNYLDINGWCSTRKRINFFEIERDLEIETQGYIWRPVSLFGIEDNNGWTKIEIESDLPEDGWHWAKSIIPNNDIWETHYDDLKLGFHTHYQPVHKPKPPLY